MLDISIFEQIKSKKEGSSEFKAFISSFDESPIIEDFDAGRRYYSYPNTGMNLVLDDARLIEIQLFTDGIEERTANYKGQLPHGLSFLDSIEEVGRKLGVPNICKDGVHNHSLLGVIYPWCKYSFDGYSLRVEFTMDKSKIRILSLA